MLFGKRTRRPRNSKGNDVVDAVMFQAEIRRIEKLLYRIAWSFLGNNADVEDAVQDLYKQ